MSARVFIFGYTDNEKTVIDGKLEELGIPSTSRIQATQGDVVLRDIIEKNPRGQGNVETGDPVVLFHEVSDKGVFALMNIVKAVAVPRPIFAVVTEQSVNWTFSELLHHLTSEKEAMAKRTDQDQKEE